MPEVVRAFSSTLRDEKRSLSAPVIFAGAESVATDVFRDGASESDADTTSSCPHAAERFTGALRRREVVAEVLSFEGASVAQATIDRV